MKIHTEHRYCPPRSESSIGRGRTSHPADNANTTKPNHTVRPLKRILLSGLTLLSTTVNARVPTAFIHPHALRAPHSPPNSPQELSNIFANRHASRITHQTLNSAVKRSDNLHTIEVNTSDSFKEVVLNERDRLVVVMFRADICKMCKKMKPFFRRVAELNPNIKFVEVPHSDRSNDLFQSMNLKSIPFGHVYKEGELLHTGSLGKKNFKPFLGDIGKYFGEALAIRPTENNRPHS